MSMSFEILGLSPSGLATPALAVAVSRAGGAGLINLEFCPDAEQATAQFQRLLQDARGRIGLRVTAAEAGLAHELIHAAGERALTLILAGDAAGLTHLAKALAPRRADRL
ncbi:MAG: hypothetical protein ACREUF_06495, partial [Solimonas sp.]